ncbi:MAG: hypothetical protein LKM32_11575 [Chiayiivirga sp.]|jgi:hypothetical protein|uniref:hypothetical protein n=1 Tax=Chiayiivirga sp. TaxID=2041042 RepID=UPI0025C65110|nr:hypothetical protein [Chiayiivirga sp.]MCI1729989.1 hypothetical protein [Chiayiivirga sp.]
MVQLIEDRSILGGQAGRNLVELVVVFARTLTEIPAGTRIGAELSALPLDQIADEFSSGSVFH